MMKKWIVLLKSVMFSFVVYMWFLGSTLFLQIQSNHGNDERKDALLRQELTMKTKWKHKGFNVSESINLHCGLDREERSLVVNKVRAKGGERLGDKKSDGERLAKETLLQARREKTVRDSVFFIPQLQQLWCLVPKAASTSWSHKILDSIPNVSSKLQSELGNVSIPVQVILRKHYGNIGTKKYNEIIGSENIQKILLVRHPLSRIVSAFEDKLKDRKARGDSMYFYGHYGVKINRAFRKNRRQNKRKEPTFEEFIDYLIQTDPEDYDEHWKPISLLCGVCHIKYNHIIKLENLKNDLEFHLKKLGYISTNTKVKLRSDNKSVKELNNVIDYFRNITEEKRLHLFQKYKDDFKLFQYDMERII